VYIGSFSVYIVLDYIGKKSILSDPYARVQYYFVILLVAYEFISEALRLRIEDFVERSVFLSLYALAAVVAVYISWKAKHDRLAPSRV